MKIESSYLKAESKSTAWSPVSFGFQIRPYGILFTIALVLYMYKTMNNQTSSFKLITPPEFKIFFVKISDKIITLRKDHPSYLCGISSLFLGILAVIAHFFSGSTLVVIGIIIAGFFSTRYKFKIVQIPLIVNFNWAEKFDREITDEFLPEVNESNLFVLQRAGDEAIVSSNNPGDEDENSDEIPSELMIPESIPEIDENSDSSEDDLILQSSLVEDETSTRELNNQKMQFKKGYFKKDSSISTSSSDEENLSKGLNFDYVDGSEILMPSQMLQKVQSTSQSSAVGNIASQLPGIMTNFVSWSFSSKSGSGCDKKTVNIRSKNSNALYSTDDESEFEFVETDQI